MARFYKERLTKIAKCAGCALEKKVYHLGLCARCYDYQRFGGRENYNRIRREQADKYRKTRRGKVMVKAYNASESTITRKREHRRERKKDPETEERYRHVGRRWRDRRPAGKPVGSHRDDMT